MSECSAGKKPFTQTAVLSNGMSGTNVSVLPDELKVAGDWKPMKAAGCREVSKPGSVKCVHVPNV